MRSRLPYFASTSHGSVIAVKGAGRKSNDDEAARILAFAPAQILRVAHERLAAMMQSALHLRLHPPPKRVGKIVQQGVWSVVGVGGGGICGREYGYATDVCLGLFGPSGRLASFGECEW